MIYVLKLENDKYYVGSTLDFEHRYNQHKTGNGAKYTS